MNAVERIEAAITKLERLKGSSTRIWAKSAAEASDLLEDLETALCLHDLRDADLELALTLHRTVDAQLAILGYAVEAWRSVEAEGSPNFLVRHVQGYMAEHEIALADAILGDRS